jgi:uncharacterized iron-regulated membrane protein
MAANLMFQFHLGTPGGIGFAIGMLAVDCAALYLTIQGLLHRHWVKRQRDIFESIVVTFKY